MKIKYLGWFLFAFFGIGVGAYPLAYFFGDMSQGLLASKPAALLADSIWHFCFYTHISFGGIALTIGWSQFVKKWRVQYLFLHRRIGQLYIVSVLLSGFTGLYIAYFATGGWIAILGFASLGLLWLFTTFRAYTSVRNKDIEGHQDWMIRSYALTFGAVTLRLWLPLFTQGFGIPFIPAYLVIAWLAWVPNLFVAEWIIRRGVKVKTTYL